VLPQNVSGSFSGNLNNVPGINAIKSATDKTNFKNNDKQGEHPIY
jgi:hypothetical protein